MFIESVGLRNTRPLCSIVRGITEQNITERVAFIAAQYNITLFQGSTVPQLILLALEVSLDSVLFYDEALDSVVFRQN